ncbi:hypothetical protein M2366_003656 [Aeromonas sp. BIGb0405]|uniref:lipase family protein n=1 Tax=Aeromonas sp. BIGb0405 TaxID=2940592 RepID=UPI00216A119E|nr:lipase family protein [Aeromonas sp. BIGb0405]MCS3457540.1 hypothetical protein [Aeromonas sp. BIGb0405]
MDELDQPIANVPYTLHHSLSMASDSIGGKVAPRTGVTGSDGSIKEKELPAGPVKLVLAADPLATTLQEPHRYLRLSRKEEESAVRAKALGQGRQYRYARMGELVDEAPTNIADWEDDLPPAYHFPHAEQGLQGMRLGLLPTAGGPLKLTVEVCPLRAWVLALNHSPDYDLGNAHNLALMAALAYADGEQNEAGVFSGSIQHFFTEQMQDLARQPYQVNGLKANPLVRDVPFDDRYRPPVFINAAQEEKSWFKFKFDTQFFYVERPGELLVSWRGTASGYDALTDLNYQPVPCPDITKVGEIHEGFYRQYKAVEQHPVKEIRVTYNDISLKLGDGLKLFIAGHSLGGALALIHAVSLKKYSPCLYTYGMPRTFTKAALAEIGPDSTIHYRHINEADPVPSVPPGREMDNPTFAVPGLGYVLAPITAPLALLNPFEGDPYQHHGKVVHFYRSHIRYRAPKLPGQGGSRGDRDQVQDYRPLPKQVKLYLVPALARQEKAELQEREQAAEQRAEVKGLFPAGDNPETKVGLGPAAHSSLEYAGYIRKRITGLLAEQHQQPDPFVEQKSEYLAALTAHQKQLYYKVAKRENALLWLDQRLNIALPEADELPLRNGLERFWLSNQGKY